MQAAARYGVAVFTILLVMMMVWVARPQAQAISELSSVFGGPMPSASISPRH